MCMRNGEDGVEQARSRVKTDEIVVHGAKITCSCEGRNGKANYIKVLDGHGIMENGNHCAHDGSCVPIKNIELCISACKESADGFGSFGRRGGEEKI